MGKSVTAVGSMGPNDFGDWYQPLQNAHNREHADYYASKGTGCEWHPNTTEDQRMADKLVTELKADLGW